MVGTKHNPHESETSSKFVGQINCCDPIISMWDVGSIIVSTPLDRSIYIDQIFLYYLYVHLKFVIFQSNMGVVVTWGGKGTRKQSSRPCVSFCLPTRRHLIICFFFPVHISYNSHSFHFKEFFKHFFLFAKLTTKIKIYIQLIRGVIRL